MLRENPSPNTALLETFVYPSGKLLGDSTQAAELRNSRNLNKSRNLSSDATQSLEKKPLGLIHFKSVQQHKAKAKIEIYYLKQLSLFVQLH